MSNEINKKQKKSFANKLRNVFTEEIKEHLKVIEKERIRYITYSFLSLLAIPIFIALFFFYLNNSESVNIDINFVVFFIAGPLALSYFILKRYKTKAKSQIMPLLLSCLGDFKCVPKEIKKNQDDKAYFKRLKLIPPFDSCSVDDRIVGQYNNLQVDIYEVELARIQRSRKSYSKTIVFSGLLVKVPLLKNSNTVTLIKPKAIKIGDSKNIVKLEDPEFNKHFDVYSLDQVEARYLITTAFMSRLIKIVKMKMGEVSLSFEEGYVNIAIDNKKQTLGLNIPFLKKDWFEVSIFQKATDIRNYRKILEELQAILDVIDNLKLTQNIGL